MDTLLRLVWGIVWRVVAWGAMLGAGLGLLFGGVMAFGIGFIVGGVFGGLCGLVLGLADGIVLAAISAWVVALPGPVPGYRLVLGMVSALIAGGGMIGIGLLGVWPMSAFMTPFSAALAPALLAARAGWLTAGQAARWAVYYGYVGTPVRGA